MWKKENEADEKMEHFYEECTFDCYSSIHIISGTNDWIGFCVVIKQCHTCIFTNLMPNTTLSMPFCYEFEAS